MNILITGGAGFIGSHLVDRLLETGDEVYVIDDLSTGSLMNVKQHQDQKKFHLIVDTILNEAVMNDLISGCDQIYHLAAAVGVKLVMNKPVKTIETNMKGTEMVLRLANRHKKKVLITSSSEVYGKVMNGKNATVLLEDTDRLMGSTTKRRWAYACSKAMDEFLALAYYEEKKLPVIITRLFNIVGPRQTGQYGMVVPSFVQKALIGKPITVYGDGTQSRTFTYVADAIDALTKLMNEPAAVGKIFNIGSVDEITIKELALMAKEMTESSSEIEYIPYEKAYGPGYEDMQRRCPDVTRLKELIHFEPKTDLKGIIQSVIDYYEK
jgi:UDP-glucose 4-epimerase